MVLDVLFKLCQQEEVIINHAYLFPANSSITQNAKAEETWTYTHKSRVFLFFTVFRAFLVYFD